MSEILGGDNIDSFFEKDMLPQEEVAPTGGSFKDYMLTTSAVGMDIYYPEAVTRQKDTDGILDFEDDNFKTYFDAQPIEARRNMMEANSNDEAYKIGLRNEVQHDAMNRISEDGIVTQLGMSLVPGIINPSSILPVGVIGGTLFRTSLGAGRIVAAGAAGAASGALANVIDESIFEARNMHYDYANAAMYGAMFGGVLGTGAGAIDTMFRGPYGTRNAEIVATPQRHEVPQGRGLAEGVTAEPIQRNIFDKVVPILTDDIHKSYQSVSPTIREVISKAAPSMVALKDAAGNYIVQVKTALDFKRNFQGYHSNLDVEVGKIYGEANYKGNREQFEMEISDIYHRLSNEQEMKAYEAGHREAEAARRLGEVDAEVKKVERKAREDYYNRPLDMSGVDAHLAKGVERYRKYYKDVLQSGKDLSMKQLKDVNGNKLYKTRMIDYNKVKNENDPNLVVAIKDAFESHPANKDLSPEDMGTLIQHYVNFIKDAKFKQNFSHDSFLIPMDANLPAESRLLGRKFRLDETKMTDYLLTDMKELTSMYNYQMGGRQALQYGYGTDNMHEYMRDVQTRLEDEGNAHLSKDINALRRSIEDVGGTLRMNQLSGTPAWTATRVATAVQSIRLGGRFGINQMLELMGNVSMNHIPSVMKGGVGQSFKTAAKMLVNKDGTPNTDMSRMLLNAGFLQDALSNHHINRAADIESGFNSGKLEKWMNNVSHKYFALNGMRFTKIFQENLMGGALMREIPHLAKKQNLGEADLARIASWGLTPDTLRAVAGEINTHLNYETGNFDLFAFSEQNRDLFQLAMTRNMDRTVLQGDSVYVANSFKDANVAEKLVFQFMRFPSMAHNIYLRRGLSQDKARMGGALVGNMLGFMMFKYLQEEAATQLGFVDGHKRKYDYFGVDGEEHMMRAVQQSLNYGAPLGMMSTGWNYGAHLSGNPELGRDYVSKEGIEGLFGPTFGMVNTAIELGRHSFGNSKMTDERAMLQAKTLIFGQNYPIIDEGLKDLIKENF